MLSRESISLGDALLRAAAAGPERDAVVLPGERWSYGRLAERAQGIARSLAALGVAPGDRVAVLMPNSAECLAALFGTALAGATVVPINARFKAPEMRHILADSGAKVVLTSDLMDAHSNLSDQLRAATTEVPIVLLGAKVEEGLIGEAEFDALGVEFERPQVALRDTAMLLYTSGTTAQPRGCRISHEALIGVWGGVADAMDITAQDAVWNPCPMFHIAAIGVSVSCVVVGAANVTTRHFDPGESVELLAAERPSVWYPAYDRIMLGIVNHPRFGEIDLSNLKSVLAVGQPDTLRRLQAAVPDAVLVSTFGMTESAGCAVIARVDDPEPVRMETAGGPVEGLEARLAEDGEILLRGPLLFDGYHNEAASPFVDGWFHTGDLGARVHDRITFRGRKKEMLRVGGENVAPAQIEATLMAHPAVQMAAVIGRPDERLDEVPYAFVELRADATEAELIEHCRASLASFKVPRRVRFVEQWPMSATKIQKFKLRERMENEAATMPGLVDLWTARTPDADAARFPGGVSSYAELSASSRRSAAALHGAGVRFGDRIGVLLLEGTERYLSLVLGAGRLGADPGAAERALQDARTGLRDAPRGPQAALHRSVVRGPGGRVGPAAGLHRRTGGGGRGVLGRRGRAAARRRAPAGPGADALHVGHDGEPEGLRAQPRVDGRRGRRLRRALRGDERGPLLDAAAALPHRRLVLGVHGVRSRRRVRARRAVRAGRGRRAARAVGRDDRLPRLRDDLAARAPPPAVPGGRRERAAAGAQRRRARAAADDAGDAAERAAGVVHRARPSRAGSCASARRPTRCTRARTPTGVR